MSSVKLVDSCATYPTVGEVPQPEIRRASTKQRKPGSVALRAAKVPLLAEAAAINGCCVYFRSRRTLPGPEAELVQRFLKTFRPKLPSSCRAVTFIEPRIGNAFPDIVIAVMHLPTVSKWPQERKLLTVDDLRLAQLFHSTGPIGLDRLQYLFGKTLSRSLDRLEAAKLIHRRGEQWRLASLGTVFGIRQLLAFEAKISPTRHALRQARANMWFATSSSLLVPKSPKSSEVVIEAAQQGVGIVIADGGKIIAPAALCDCRQPASYGSWLFNEWSSQMLMISSGKV